MWSAIEQQIENYVAVSLSQIENKIKNKIMYPRYAMYIDMRRRERAQEGEREREKTAYKSCHEQNFDCFWFDARTTLP